MKKVSFNLIPSRKETTLAIWHGKIIKKVRLCSLNNLRGEFKAIVNLDRTVSFVFCNHQDLESV